MKTYDKEQFEDDRGELVSRIEDLEEAFDLLREEMQECVEGLVKGMTRMRAMAVELGNISCSLDCLEVEEMQGDPPVVGCTEEGAEAE